jgi:hypothetical protein
VSEVFVGKSSQKQLRGKRGDTVVNGPAIDTRRVDAALRAGKPTSFRGLRQEHVMPNLGCQPVKLASWHSLVKPDGGGSDEVGSADHDSRRPFDRRKLLFAKASHGAAGSQ